MKRMLLSLAALPLAACVAAPFYAQIPPPAPALPMAGATAMVTIGFGGQAMLNSIRIRPLAVVEDSRCAINVQCVWAGRLILAVEIGQRGGSETLRTNMTLGQPVAVEGGRLTLVAARPPKVAGAQGNPSASQFTFELTR